MSEVRFATVTWNGDLTSGAGMIKYVSSGVISRLPISWASRTSAHDGRTSPEELLAAAHASCFSMAFSSRLAKNGTTATSLEVRAEVTFEQGTAGWSVKASALKVEGVVPGIDLETFQRLAEDAKYNCPISQAIKGNVELSVEATLAEA
jgi:osmotically inducible protein OsmC